MNPPYPAPYWEALTPRQRLNDLVHKIAQRRGIGYPDAYAIAAYIIDAPDPCGRPYAVRLARAGLLETAIERLIEYHAATLPDHRKEDTCLL